MVVVSEARHRETECQAGGGHCQCANVFCSSRRACGEEREGGEGVSREQMGWERLSGGFRAGRAAPIAEGGEAGALEE